MIPELLSPAGNMEKLRAAFRYGADAVYLAGKRFGMRAAADNFTPDQIAEAVKYANERGKKIYLTLNTMTHGPEYPDLCVFLDSLRSIGIHAIICADLGVMSLVQKMLPDIELHASTQCSIVSAAAAEAYGRLGCRRVVLARELTLEEIRLLRRETSREIELEAFIHGSMCVAYSGRCLLSRTMIGRDANQGACAQPCRWKFTADAASCARGCSIPQVEITEEKRPGMPFPIEQNENGSFILSSKDLCMIEHIPDLMESGIDSFKIEGRMKSAYYTAVTANAYRMAMDAYLKDPTAYTFRPEWLAELESVSHREYATGFFYDRPMDDPCLVSQPGYLREKAYLAHAVCDSEDGRAYFMQHNKLSAGETVSLITPGQPGREFTVSELCDENGAPIESAPHPMMRFSCRVPFPVKEGDILRGA